METIPLGYDTLGVKKESGHLHATEQRCKHKN